MRFRAVAAGVAVAVAVVGSSGGTAFAQSFFEKLFGIGAAAPAPAKVQKRAAPVGQERVRDIPMGPAELAWRARRAAREEATETGPKYRTMCVRMCDGYYFPVSNATSRKNFSRDARACASQCGEEGRLFYAPDRGEPDRLVDLSGRPYTELPNAFRYRKSLIAGCACKPAPWSEEAMARHRQYAMEEDARRNQTKAPVAVAEARPAPVLPPAITGAGVMIISSAGDLLAEAPPTRVAAPAASERAPVVTAIPPPSPPLSSPLAAFVPGASPVLAPAPKADAVATAMPEASPETVRSGLKPRKEARTREARAQRSPVRMIATVSADKPKPQRIAAPRASQPSKKIAMAQGGGMTFLGGAKYTYPGDAPPRRYR